MQVKNAGGFPSLHRDGPIEAYTYNILLSAAYFFHPFTGMAPLKRPKTIPSVAKYPFFHPFTGMAPLKLSGDRDLVLEPRFFHPFTGMAPLKPVPDLLVIFAPPLFHPFTGMAPLKRLGTLSSRKNRRRFPSLHRDGPIEAQAEKNRAVIFAMVSIPSQGWPH